jgi:hypothetical protein
VVAPQNTVIRVVTAQGQSKGREPSGISDFVKYRRLTRHAAIRKIGLFLAGGFDQRRPNCKRDTAPDLGHPEH